MEMNQAGCDRLNIARMVKAASVLFGVAAIGYIAFMPPNHATGASAATKVTSDANAGAQHFDYFPAHYVNEATKNEEPVATF